MASQTITIPAATLTVDTASRKQWRLDGDDAVPVDVALADGGASIVLRRVTADSSGGLIDFMRLHFAADGTVPIGTTGDDLSERWEVDGAAITFAQGAASVPIPGPGHESNLNTDTEDAYIWTPSAALSVLLQEFFFASVDTDIDVAVTFSDETPLYSIEYGDILVVESGADLFFSHDGTDWDAGLAVPTAETFPTGVAVDPVNGDIIIVGPTTDRVFRHDGSVWDAGLPVPTDETFPAGVVVGSRERRHSHRWQHHRPRLPA